AMRNIKTTAVLFVTTCVLCAVLSMGAQPKQAPAKPNIIFIFADDLGWGDLGCYGHRQIQTSNLDRLAEEGTLFTQFYVNSAVCSPSRTAFMTGNFPARHRVHGHFAQAQRNQARGMPNWLDPAATTVTKLLKQSGYQTGHFGKWHLGSGPGAPDPGDYGIDVHRTTNSNGPGWDQNDPYFRAKSTALIVEETIRFIEANRDQPFYVNLWTLVPHATLHPTEEEMKPYRRLGPAKVPYKGAMQIYYASVTALDREIGRLLQKLDELGLARNTIVFFSSDNGPEDIHIRNASHSGVGSPGPLRGRKRSLYEGGTRMPFIVRWPNRVPAGRVDDTSVLTAVDFLPTLCKLAGIELPAGTNLDGEDVSDVLLGRPRARTKPILWEWRFNIAGHPLNRSPMLAIRQGNWKLLMNPDRSRLELYDIPRDASELNNQADRYPQVVKRLSQTVLSWHKTLPKGPVEPTAGRNDYPWPRPLSTQ
ncbi:sulfatase-like hydrolase/transferase, partial [Acidobacteria bacterium AH-259-O06]|nr:sulfatase-like hydrolase/transferase [Acidobacteria bacterium AH-259-O06]